MNGNEGRGRCERLIVFVPPRREWGGAGRPGGLTGATVVFHAAIDAGGRVVQGEAAIERLPRARSCELVFSALDVSCASVQAPNLSDARLRQALPNLLEERLLGEPLDHHFAYERSPAREGGAQQQLAVLAIERATLARALEVFALAQQDVRRATSEIHALAPPQGARLDARARGHRGAVRTGADEGCSFDLDDPVPAALALACRNAGATQLRVLGEVPARLEEIAASLGLAIAREPLAFDEAALEAAPNLLQGTYAPGGTGMLSRAVDSLARSGAWRAPAAWLLACVVACVLGLNALWIAREAQLRHVRQQMRQAYLDAFPDQTSVVDELEQARSAVGALRARAGRHSADDFVPLDSQAQRILANAPAAIVAAVEYGDHAYRIRFKPGAMDSPALRDALHLQAQRLGLTLRFDADGSALLRPQP